MGYQGTRTTDTRQRTDKPKPYNNNQQGSSNLSQKVDALAKRLGRLEAGMADDKWLESLTTDIELINGSTIKNAKIQKVGKFNLIVSENNGKQQYILCKQAILRYIPII